MFDVDAAEAEKKYMNTRTGKISEPKSVLSTYLLSMSGFSPDDRTVSDPDDYMKTTNAQGLSRSPDRLKNIREDRGATGTTRTTIWKPVLSKKS